MGWVIRLFVVAILGALTAKAFEIWYQFMIIDMRDVAFEWPLIVITASGPVLVAAIAAYTISRVIFR